MCVENNIFQCREQAVSADLLIAGELLVEIMRDRADVPLDRPDVFRGPYPSGAPAICIDAAARLGVKTELIGGVGKDDFGKMLLERLKTDGVGCSLIHENDRLSTGCAFVTYAGDGSRKFIFHMGAASEPVFPSPQKFGAIKYMHVMGCSLMAGPSLAGGIIRTVRALKKAGTKISFDPNLRPELFHDPSAGEIFREILSCASVFLPGRDELLLTTGASSVENAVRACFKNPQLEFLVLKSGAEGCILFLRDEGSGIRSVRIPAYPVRQKDATGAGDCFDGAFLAGLILGKSPEEAARMGAAAGAQNAMEFGPMEGKISPESVAQMIRRGTDPGSFTHC